MYRALSVTTRLALTVAGNQTTTVTQVDRSEPDPGIFEIPSGYKVIQRGAQ
jgi:hypothetical protein